MLDNEVSQSVPAAALEPLSHPFSPSCFLRAWAKDRWRVPVDGVSQTVPAAGPGPLSGGLSTGSLRRSSDRPIHFSPPACPLDSLLVLLKIAWEVECLPERPTFVPEF